VEAIVAFALYVFVDGKRVPEIMRFRDINECVFFAKKLHAQGHEITAHCVPEAVSKDMRVY
tara:strand:- start:190 stop:372 length:183 start_codon:yes stop_codon:yes gene_type:complete